MTITGRCSIFVENAIDFDIEHAYHLADEALPQVWHDEGPLRIRAQRST